MGSILKEDTCRLASYLGFTLGAETIWVHNPLGIFCFCAAWTHLGSAITHVWPDSHALVRAILYELAQCSGSVSWLWLFGHWLSSH